MGLLKLIQKEEKRPLGVCIPEHQRKRAEKFAKEETKKVIKSDAAFEVTDCFQIHEFAIIRGNVVKGIITEKDKLLIEGKKIQIAELRINDKKVSMLNEGDSGAIFINTKGLRLLPGAIVHVE